MKLPRLSSPNKSDHPSKENPATNPSNVPDKPKEAKAPVVNKTKSDEKSRDETAQVTKTAKPQLYVYCIVPSTAPKDYGKIGVGSDAPVYTIEHKDIAAVVSEFTGERFEKNGANALAHQRVVQKVFEKQLGVPIEFGTMVASSGDVQRYLEVSYVKFKKELVDLKPGAGPALDDAAGPTDIIAQILSQSAASAVKIRQMTDALDDLRRRQYEKGADRLPEGAAKELLEFLAKAPPGAYEATETPVGSRDEEIQNLQRRLDTIFEDITYLRDLVTKLDTSESMIAVKKEQNKINEAVAGLRSLYTDNVASLENTVRQTLGSYFETVPPAIEAFVKKTVQETVTNQSQTLLPATIGVPEAREPPILPRKEGRSLLPGAERVLELIGSGEASSYAKCVSCGAQIVITDKFCYHCGRPNVLQEPGP